ncbi:LytR/AlgR family response regulator transcription factor [Polaribacter aquimarinus]|uniref:HTH LytTR-type domain-containing protein n=1 Tax=Polaribacter aquimarinus TaxID=2100726 RepID=A0A2U2JC25_9FLAO|nr:LytTR family DNA-binding domain-containing protein [Polaribacter aquimarinus]PWG05890.1 hypothetical protein DIS07_05460 [Polaribacter aquimarinus]
MQFFNWIKKPYFFIDSPKFNLLLSFGVGFFIFLFLFTFQPFGIPSILNNIFLYTGGFGLVTFFTMLFFFVFLPFIFKDFFKDENWTVGKNILFLFLLVFIITIGNYYYNSFFQNTDNMKLLTLKNFFVYTFSLAIFPLITFTYISEKLHRIHRERTSKEIMEFKVSQQLESKNEEIKIFGDNEKETITFNLDNLVYITSQGNYASFYLKKGDGLEEKIIRNTLSNIAKKLHKKSTIFRCHKSYIINSKFMNSISGNARGYYLESDLLPNQIPISRSFKKDNLKNLIS